MYVLVAAIESLRAGGQIDRPVGGGSQRRPGVVGDRDGRRALAPGRLDDGDDVGRRPRLADGDDQRVGEPGVGAVERDHRRRREPGGQPVAHAEDVLRIDGGVVRRAAGRDDDVLDPVAPVAEGAGQRVDGAVLRREEPGRDRRLLEDLVVEAHRRAAALTAVQRDRQPARERDGARERARERDQRCRVDRVGADRGDPGRVPGHVPRRPQRDRDHRPRTGRRRDRLEQGELARLAGRRRWCRRPRHPPRPPGSRIAAISASLGAAPVTTSSTRPNRVRRAAASPGVTVEDVSAGVRSVGVGITARTVASADRASGSDRASSRTSVSDRSASSRARARMGRPTHDGQVRRRPGLAEPAAQGVDPAPGRGVRQRVDPAVPGAGEQRRLDPPLRVAVGPAQQQVDPGAHRGEDRVRLRLALRDGRHVQRVADGHAAEPVRPPEQPGHDRRRQRRRQQRPVVQRGHRHVAGHHHRHAGVDRGPEGQQVHRLEPLARGAHDRQRVMRVRVRVAQAREVLDRGGHAGSPQPAQERDAERRDTGRVVAERTDPDRRIRRRTGDVEDRGIDHVDAHRASLEPDGLADPLGEGRVVGGPDGHVAGELGRAVAERLELAALLVGRDQPRPQRVGAPGGLEGLGQLAEPARRPDVEVPEHGHPRDRRGVQALGHPGRQPVAVERHHHPAEDRRGTGVGCRPGRHPLTAPASPRTK